LIIIVVHSSEFSITHNVPPLAFGEWLILNHHIASYVYIYRNTGVTVEGNIS